MKKGHELVLLVYELTSHFPKSEQFGLTNQIRRAAVSITSNISEGFSRHSLKEKIQFYYMAHGSLSELENQLQIANDIHYIKEIEYQQICLLTSETGKLLNSLIKKTSLRS